MSFVAACSVEEVPKGSALRVELDHGADTVDVAIVHAEDDNFYAIHDECSHASIPLSDGEVDGCTLECWLHGSRFDLRTGEPTGLPATEPVPVYPVEVRDGSVYVALTSSNGVTR